MLIRHLLEGQYSSPVRIVAFNTAEGWSRDASDEIAIELAQACADRGETPPIDRRFHRRPHAEPSAQLDGLDVDGAQPPVRSSLFDHLVCAAKQWYWDLQAKRLGSLHIDDEFELGDLLNR